MSCMLSRPVARAAVVLSCLVWGAASAVLPSFAAAADAYPVRPVTILVGTPAGGPVDVSARIAAEGLAKRWGQPVVIENKVGASEGIAASQVSRAAADGYTLYVSSTNPFTNNPFLFTKLGYDPAKGFSSIGGISEIPMAFVANPKAPFQSMASLVSYAKAHPGELSWASAGVGTMNHIAGEWAAADAGIKVVQVPYKGSGPALTAVVSGDTPYGVVSLVQALPFVKNGAVRMLAVTTGKRTSMAPEVSTVAESGVPGFDLAIRTVMTAPVGTPAAIIEKINADLNAVLQSPEVQAKFVGLGADAIVTSPADLTAMLDKGRSDIGRVITNAGIKPE